jgi:hypothetical protein
MPVDQTVVKKILDDLADVDNRVEAVAVHTPAESDLNVLAYAIHHLAEDLRDLLGALD